MDQNPNNTMINLTNAVFSKLAEANELAKQLEGAAKNTAEEERVTNIVVEIGSLQGKASELGHDLRNR